MDLALLIVLASCLVASASGNVCEMILNNDKKGKDGSDFPVPHITTKEDCLNECLDDSDCIGATFQSNICRWASGEIVVAIGENIYIKECNTATTAAPPPLDTTAAAPTEPETTATTTTTTTTTTAPPEQDASTSKSKPECTISESTDTSATNHKLEVTWSSQSGCQNTCKFMSGCLHFVFVDATSTCQLYDSAVTANSVVGQSLGTRTSCNGQDCCFTVIADQSTSHTPAITMTSSNQPCQKLCMAVQQCTAAISTGTSCKLFVSAPVTSQTSGVTLLRKSCDSGADTGSLQISTTCESHATRSAAMSILSVILLSAVAGFLTRFTS